MRPKGQDAITVRVIEYRLRPEAASDLALLPVSRTSRPAEPQRVHRLVTTLLDPVQAPALDLIMHYHKRWEIELVIDEIKTHQRLSPQPLRSKSPELLYQELYGLLLAHYAVRAWMHQSALQADLDPDRLSFTHALHVLDTACYEFAIVATDDLPRLEQRMLGFLARPQVAASPSSLALLSSRRQTGLFLLSSQATLASLFRLEKRFLSGPSSYLNGIDVKGSVSMV